MSKQELGSPQPNTLRQRDGIVMPRPSASSSRDRLRLLRDTAQVAGVGVLVLTAIGSIVKFGESVEEGRRQWIAQQEEDNTREVAVSREYLEKIGLAGEVPLIDFRIDTTEIEGEYPIQELVFSWGNTENNFISDVNLNRVRFNIEEEVASTISFEFSDSSLAYGTAYHALRIDEPNAVIDGAERATVILTQESFDALLK